MEASHRCLWHQFNFRAVCIETLLSISTLYFAVRACVISNSISVIDEHTNHGENVYKPQYKHCPMLTFNSTTKISIMQISLHFIQISNGKNLLNLELVIGILTTFHLISLVSEFIEIELIKINPLFGSVGLFGSEK